MRPPPCAAVLKAYLFVNKQGKSPCLHSSRLSAHLSAWWCIERLYISYIYIYADIPVIRARMKVYYEDKSASRVGRVKCRKWGRQVPWPNIFIQSIISSFNNFKFKLMRLLLFNLSYTQQELMLHFPLLTFSQLQFSKNKYLNLFYILIFNENNNSY